MDRQRRILGPLTACGVLFVTYQSRAAAKGFYMVSVLFRSHLLLAYPSEDLSRFGIKACIPLADMRMEQPQNGHGNGTQLKTFECSAY